MKPLLKTYAVLILVFLAPSFRFSLIGGMHSLILRGTTLLVDEIQVFKND